LHLTDKAEVLHRDLERFIRTASSTGCAHTLQLASRLFGAKGFEFVPTFIALTRDRHLAALEQLDFASNPEASRRQINKWVEQRTHDRIK
jgi:serpin B